MLLQALGNFYMGMGMMLGGGSNQQQCHEHGHKDGDSARLRALENKLQSLDSVQYGHSQPQNNIMINNTNTLISR